MLRMSDNPIAQQIKARLAELGLSPRKASMRAGLSPDAIRKILDGSSASPKASTLQAIAGALDIDVASMMGQAVPRPTLASMDIDAAPQFVRLPILHRVAAGAWLAVEDASDVDPVPFLALFVKEYAGFPQWLEVVVGDSYDRRIPDGNLVHVVDAIAMGYAPQRGDTVVVVRRRAQGAFVERSLKEVVTTPFGIELWPRSHNPRWDGPLNYTEGTKEAEDIEVEIVGKVIRSYGRFD